MRDEQVRRYARHILLSDVGGLGQTALLVASARLDLREREPDAELIAATFLIAGGVGHVAVSGATGDQIAALTAHSADTQVTPEPPRDSDGRDHSRELVLRPKPAWWPSADGDAVALAFWRGGLAAARWMADIAND